MLPAAAQERVTIAYPGPMNIPYLPLELAPHIGADRAEGIQLVARHTGGGGVALQALQTRNVDFAIAGAPAAMSAVASGNDVVVISAVNDLTVYVLMVRSEFAGRITRPRDLAGRVIGVNTSSMTVKTASQQLAELILANDGLSPQQVRFVAAGQDWDQQSTAIRSGSVDAILGNEPFASRLADAGEVFFLVNLADSADAERIPGAGFLHAALATRSDILNNAPHKAEKLVAIVRRTLEWMAQHTPEQIIEALDVDDAAARASLLAALQRYPRLYSPDGRFSRQQITETDRFYAAAQGADRATSFASIIDARWAGYKP